MTNTKDIHTIENTKLTLKQKEKILRRLSKNDIVFYECVSLVIQFFQGKKRKIIAWFFTDNPLLGGISPIKMALLGRVEQLKKFILNQKKENGW